MKPVSPVIPGEKLDEVKVADHQPEYQTLPVVFLNNGNTILSRWAMDEAERKVVSVTGELFICLMTFGKPAPDCLFQVNPPIMAIDTPELFPRNKRVYPNGDLPVLAQNDSEIWYSLKLTDDDRATVERSGDVYFFMNTNGNLITPQLIQVEKPQVASIEVEFIIGLRAGEKADSVAAEFNLELVKYNCCVCNHETVISKQIEHLVENARLKVICKTCSENSPVGVCALPETVAELRSVIEQSQ
jgi:hypothetical protein